MNLEAKAKEIRRYVLETALKAGKGHIPSALSWVEIGVALFYGGMKPGDRFYLSKTHGHLTLDAILADLNLTADYPMWSGWPYVCSGSLGQGLGIAAGMALANKLSGSDARVFCVLGDAELHEGSCWEAVMFAAHHDLSRLVAIIDNNGQCCADRTRDVLNMGDIARKFYAFGWAARNVDGHDLSMVGEHLKAPPYHPTCIIAHTIKGQGISFMEHNTAFHHQLPKGDEIEQARRDLA